MQPLIVFVYGSLKKKGGNHGLLTNAVFLGSSTVQHFDMFDYGSFPVIIPGTGTIHVEVYQINNEILKSLDRLEGYPTFYTREQVSDLNGHTGWIYIAPQNQYEKIRQQYPPIPNGNW